MSRERHEGELTVAPALLARLPLNERLLTGDAEYCQRELCAQVCAAGGDYLLTVKENQPTLSTAIRVLFAQPPPGERFEGAEQRGRHGDRHEVRWLQASTALREYLAWPGVQQVFQVTSTVTRKGQTRQQVRYGLTSLAQGRADAARLLQVRRGHWAIENRLHYVRDVTFGEDASRVRSGAAPQVMAALRNAVVGLLRRWRTTNVAAALRTLAWTPGAALHLLGVHCQ